MQSAASKVDCVIRGAGIIGLSCALEMAQRGARIVLVEPRWPPLGASWAAAGMIAPAFEAAGRAAVHSDLLEASLTSAGMWPAWSKRLEVGSEMPAGYSPEAAIAVALDEKTEAELAHIRAGLDARGLDWEEIDECDLPQRAIRGLRLPTDTQVDNRKTMAALMSVCEENECVEVLATYPDNLAAPQLITAGWETPDLLPYPLPIYPLSGQMVSLERGAGDPQMPVRCGALYIVPKDDRIIVGATVEKDVVRKKPDQADIDALIAKAAVLFPKLKERAVIEAWAGVRPGTLDHAPYLGQVSDGLYVAAGHHRNGILLAPLTARLMADLILEGRSHHYLNAFSPMRDVALPHGDGGRG